MVFCLVHLDDQPGTPGDEEVYVIVPDGSKTALAVPLDAIAEFLPLLERAVGGGQLPACHCCAAPMPRLMTTAEIDDEPTTGKPAIRTALADVSRSSRSP